MPKTKKLRVGIVDFFSGCGGASYGFARATYPSAKIEIIAGIDFDEYGCSTFERMLGVPAHNIDISELVEDDNEKLDAMLSAWNLKQFDKIILIGCAPCQGFAAHRKSIKGKDHRRSLFGIFSEIATRINPDAIFMENVPDMFSKKHFQYYEAGRAVLESAGYHVRSRVYNFADFGLPQERFRAIMMAMRKPFNMPEPTVHHSKHKTVRDTIEKLPKLNSGETDPKDSMHIVSKHRQSTIDVLRQVPKDGGNRPMGVGPKCLDRAREAHGGYTDVYGRLAWDKPAVTITARCRTPSCGRFAHPEQNRGLSVREAALLQGFPLEFMFEGPFDDKYKQIGNAVPPIVAAQLGTHLIRELMASDESREVEHINGYSDDVTRPVGPGFAVTINGIKRRRARATEALHAA